MKVNLSNIGLIEDATVQIDGLTVIAGLNGTGKSTIGKTIYSLVSAVENLQEISLTDRLQYTYSKLRNIFEKFVPLYYALRNVKNSESSNPILHFFMNTRHTCLDSLIDSLEMLRVYVEELTQPNYENLIKNMTGIDTPKRLLVEHWNSKSDVIIVINNVLKSLRSDPKLQRYANKRIQITLNTVFNDQIPPQKQKSEKSESHIKVHDSNKTYFDVVLNKGKINGQKTAYLSKWLDNAILIDNPYAVDKLSEKTVLRNDFSSHVHNEDDFDEQITIEPPEESLRRKLKSETKSIFESIIREEQAVEILNLISDAFSDEITLSDGEYVVGPEKLNIKNLATGVKLFAIIKTLITKGYIKENTLLVLDEPESHLHPEWQNQLAEIIALLVKKSNVKVVLTTHSAHFMIAIDAMMRKYQIGDITNFYFNTKIEDSQMVSVKCVNDELETIYSEFLSPYAKMYDLKEKLRKG